LKDNTCENQQNELNVTNNLNAPNGAIGEELNCPSSTNREQLRAESEINVPEELNGQAVEFQADLVQQTHNNVR
jgi:hypothetical protein